MADESWRERLGASGRPRRAIARGLPRRALRRPVASGGEAPGILSTAARRRHLVVCGDDPLAQRLVEELIKQYRVRVTVILTDRHRGHGPQIARLPVDIVEADRLDGDALRRAGIHRAEALALVRQDDIGNIDAALQAHDLNPKLRLVIRMFNVSLGSEILRHVDNCRVLSDAAMAAPAFASAAVGEVPGQYIQLNGRTLQVARRADVSRDDIICGLAVTGAGDRPELLPQNQGRADMVLAVARGGRRRTETRARLRRWWRRSLRAVPSLLGRKVRIVALVLVGLLVAGTAVLKLTLERSWLNAAYLAILDTLAGANADVNGRPVVKVTETVMTVVSIALVPLVTAAVVESAVNARLALELGQVRESLVDHVVVVGLGNVGTRVVQQLHDIGIPVVAIDKNEDARGMPVVRELKIPYIIGAAQHPETLRSALVDSCRALVVVSTDDVINLETAVQARELNPDLPIVMRLFDGDFATRMRRAFRLTMSRSVSYVAAPAFAAAMFEREVIGTIPVGRRVLLIAEVPVFAGSELYGAELADVDDVGRVRVIAVQNKTCRTTLWDLPPQRRLEAGDLLVVVATRAGLSRLLVRTGPPGEPVGADASS